MGLYASSSDVGAKWAGYDTAQHQVRADVLIGEAETLIQDRIPDLALRISNGVISTKTVNHVVTSMVIRVLRNPEGYRSESDGDYNYAYAPGAYTPGEVGLTVSDLSRLRGSRGGVTVGPGDDVALGGVDVFA